MINYRQIKAVIYVILLLKTSGEIRNIILSFDLFCRHLHVPCFTFLYTFIYLLIVLFCLFYRCSVLKITPPLSFFFLDALCATVIKAYFALKQLTLRRLLDVPSFVATTHFSLLTCGAELWGEATQQKQLLIFQNLQYLTLL